MAQQGDNNDVRIAGLTTQDGSGNTATVTQEQRPAPNRRPRRR
ncbi:hypothetical protein [Salinibacter ruber]